MSKAQYQTASGASIPATDVQAIRKDARNETVMKILATVGAITVGYFVAGIIRAMQEAKASED